MKFVVVHMVALPSKEGTVTISFSKLVFFRSSTPRSNEGTLVVKAMRLTRLLQVIA